MDPASSGSHRRGSGGGVLKYIAWDPLNEEEPIGVDELHHIDAVDASNAARKYVQRAYEFGGEALSPTALIRVRHGRCFWDVDVHVEFEPAFYAGLARRVGGL